MAILHQTVRDHLSTSLRSFQEQLGNGQIDDPLTLGDIDELVQALIVENSRAVLDSDRSFFEPELSRSYLGLLTLGILSLAIERDAPIFPADWISDTLSPDPNVVIGQLVRNLANYALGTIRLIELGLESASRAILRHFLELSWLVLLVTHDQKAMATYFRNDMGRINPKEQITPCKIRAALKTLESDLGVTSEMSENFAKEREDNYNFLCGYAHNRYFSAFLASHAWSVDKGGFIPNLFGKLDGASYSTLGMLNDAASDFLSRFLLVFSQTHKKNLRHSQLFTQFAALAMGYKSVIESRDISKEFPTFGGENTDMGECKGDIQDI